MTDTELEREYEALFAAQQSERPGVEPIVCGWVMAFFVVEVAAILAFFHWYPQICAAWDAFRRGM